MRKFGIGLLSGVFLMVVFVAGAFSDRLWALPFLDKLLPQGKLQVAQRLVTEESVVTEVAERVSPAVVTVSYKEQRAVMQDYFLDPFGFFGRSGQAQAPESKQVDIGSGFVVDKAGLVVTNKHVVAEGTAQDYKVVLKDNSEHQVEKIWRDPTNDLAILKITDDNLQAVELGDSDTLKVGNFVIAIGTALGEFRHTVTTGVVSGLSRGITAGDRVSGFSENLSDVIQTDAAINPGNSGGPLLNSSGQVVGVNVAVTQGANNIGFALPINVVKASLAIFNETGQFDRAYLGVRYRLIDTETAVLNKLVAGAYVVEVLKGSAADEAGLQVGDVIVSLDERRVVDEKDGLAGLLLHKKIGDKIKVDYYRKGASTEVEVTLKGE